MRRLAGQTAPDERETARLLGVSFGPRKENRYWRFLEASDVPPPWDRIELRLAKDEPRGLLVLEIADDAVVSAEDVVAPEWGRPALDVNPDIPPEGVVHHVYDLGGTTLSLRFTVRSEVLRGITIRWGA